MHRARSHEARTTTGPRPRRVQDAASGSTSQPGRRVPIVLAIAGQRNLKHLNETSNTYGIELALDSRKLPLRR